MNPKLIVDADDFSEQNHRLDLLLELKARIPGFRITLFTIPGLSSPAFVQSVRTKYDWIDLAAHGKFHATNYECLHWTCKQSREYLDWIEAVYGDLFTKGFRAPGWQVSDGLYQALDERGWWCADQAYNNARRIPGLRAYILDSPEKLHFHIGGTMDNELGKHMDALVELRDREFQFVKDVM